MVSERTQRQIDRLLDQAEEAISSLQWEQVREYALAALALDSHNGDARNYLAAAETRAGVSVPPPADEAGALPSSFANGRYHVARFLGEGGKKRVYLAHDTRLDRDVAFAVIKTDGLDTLAQERITREAQAMGKLGDHPNIVAVYDIGEEGGQPYVVTQYMPGGDVEGLLAREDGRRLAAGEALRLAGQVCAGLEFAHGRGIVHRDLKPGNVWLSHDGTAKIGDFGLAVAIDKTRLTQAGMMVGTVAYMPPEQATGGEPTPKSDLYSLGCMLYELVCSQPPFVGDGPVAIIGQHLNTPPVAPSWYRPDAPPGLEALILRLRAGAIQHLDFAIQEFRVMKMQPSLERALRHRELLGASKPDILERYTRFDGHRIY